MLNRLARFAELAVLFGIAFWFAWAYLTAVNH